MTNRVFLYLCILWILCIISFAKIYDPLKVFCGEYNCYDLLGLSPDASLKDIKKAYRKVSLTLHPDKNKDANATEVFQLITKAYEILSGNDSRPLFDYYLKNPKDYFKVSGQHYYEILPKSDVRLIVVVVIGLLSWFFHTIQYQKYEKIVKYLRSATLNNLTLNNGGTKQTLELYKRASEIYDEKIKELRAKGEKSKVKMTNDPLFEKIVNEIVAEVKVEGGYRKPEWKDLFAVHCVLFPYYIVLWAMKYHRRYISKNPLPSEDKLEMARDKIGLFTWEETSDEQKQKFIDMEIWKDEVYNAWVAEMEAEELKRQSKSNKGSKKKKRRNQADSDDEVRGDEYID